jgi:uncharacterized protein YkwD
MMASSTMLNHRNAGRKRIASTIALSCVLLVPVSGCSIVEGQVATPEPTVTGQDLPVVTENFAQQLEAATNAARAKAGLSELQVSTCARDVALPRAQALVGVEVLTHDSLFVLNRDCGLAGGLSAENLVRGAGSPQELVEAWLNSPGHRMNLLNPDYTQLGIACVNDPDQAGSDRHLCSQLFLG